MIPPLRIAPKSLSSIPRPPKPQPWENLSHPNYWLGDRLLTVKGWGICTGIKLIYTGNWLYYIDLDDHSSQEPFAEVEILKAHTGH